MRTPDLDEENSNSIQLKSLSHENDFLMKRQSFYPFCSDAGEYLATVSLSELEDRKDRTFRGWRNEDKINDQSTWKFCIRAFISSNGNGSGSSSTRIIIICE